MAKLEGVLAYRKKLGTTVGYSLKNSNNAQTAGVRVYQPVVTNPKTTAQSSQRMKLMPLTMFYEAFNDVLNHAFEGKRVGQMNRQRFMQLNMSSTSGLAPAVQKGERLLAPIKCQVSSGSVVVDTSLTAGSGDDLTSTIKLVPNIAVMGSQTAIDIARVSRLLIEGNLGFEEGMEFAVIAIVSSDGTPRIGVPLKGYFVLDTTDEITTLRDTFKSFYGRIQFATDSNGYLYLHSEDNNVKFLGAAIIISKRKTNGWSNTNSRFVPTAFGESLFYDNGLYNAALDSYGPVGRTLESDLFLQQADNVIGASSPTDVVSTTRTAITLKSAYAGGTLTQSNAMIAVQRNGVQCVVVGENDVVIGADGTPVYITTGVDQEQTTRPLLISMTELEGSRTRRVGSF